MVRIASSTYTGTRPFEENTANVLRALEYMKLQPISEPYMIVAGDLLLFHRAMLQADDKLPTSKELGDWYRDVGTRVRNLLESRIP
jgi:hypothetical protein